MSSPDYGNFFNAAAALFPILVLTKTVSFRNRSAASPSELAKAKGCLDRLRQRLEKWSIADEKGQYRSQGGHVLHILFASVGEVFALTGLWGETKGLGIAIVVAVLLGIAAIPLAIELLTDAFRT